MSIDALHRKSGRKLAEGARRAQRRLVGAGDLDLHVAHRPGVGVGQFDGAEERHQEAPVDPLAAVAAVADTAIAQGQQLPVLCGRDLEVVDLVALLAHRHQVLLARFDPAHRPTELLRHVGDDDRLPVEGRLDAEAAALIARRDDADLLRRNVEDVRERQAVDVRPLGRDVRGQTVGVVPQAERAAGLHRRDAAAVTAEAFAHDDVGGIERLLHLGIVLRLVFRRRARP